MTHPGKEIFDALVVGSGASGGWACKRLTEAGLKVALLDAGPAQTDKNFTEHMPAFQLKYRNLAPEVIRKTRPLQSQCDACTEYNYEWFCNDLDEPYTTPPDMPYLWAARMRIGGGQTNVWGRASYRYSDLDFKAASFDGYGEDWPLGYRDLAPYYDIVERYIGVAGRAEGFPYLPDGIFQPDMGMTCSEVFFREKVKAKLGWLVTPGRTACLTKPLNGRWACHYCGPCERGCLTHSYFNSSFTTVSDAIKSGNLTYIPNVMVYKILMDSERNRAKGLLYIDRATRQPREVMGRVVVVGAHCLESVRILFNSATRQYPNGLGNSSGVLGHYLMNTLGNGGATGELPQFMQKPTVEGGGPIRPTGIFVPRFRNLPGGPRSPKFLRGYVYAGSGKSNFDWTAPGFGEVFKKTLLEPRSRLGLGTMTEGLARWDNYVKVDPNVVDTYGIPVLHIHMSFGKNEFALLNDAVDSVAEMLEAARAKNIRKWQGSVMPGSIRHEAGVARMGNNPKNSVLNQFQQSHDIKNLFVVDGSGFVSLPSQNPAITLMALCVRSCDYLMGEMKRGNL